ESRNTKKPCLPGKRPLPLVVTVSCARRIRRAAAANLEQRLEHWTPQRPLRACPPTLDADSHALSRAEPHPQRVRIGDHRLAVGRALDRRLVHLFARRLLGVTVDGGAVSRLPGATVHDSTRLRSRRILPEQMGKRL